MQLTFDDVDCRELLRELAATLAPLAESKGLRFEIVAPAERTSLRSDRRALGQVLINLTSNAIKFTERGSVTVALTRDPNRPETVQFDVIDTGVGIRQEDQTKLFEAFEQLEPTCKREGTGLGLHLCRKLAELLGARIDVQSEFGKGAASA